MRSRSPTRRSSRQLGTVLLVEDVDAVAGRSGQDDVCGPSSERAPVAVRSDPVADRLAHRLGQPGEQPHVDVHPAPAGALGDEDHLGLEGAGVGDEHTTRLGHERRHVRTEVAPDRRHDRGAERRHVRRRIGGVRREASAEVDDGEVGAAGSDDGAQPGGRRQRLVPRRDVVLLASDVEADAHRVAVRDRPGEQPAGRHLVAAELLTECPVGAGSAGGDPYQQRGAGCQVDQLVQLGVAVDGEPAYAAGVGVGDVDGLLHGVAVGDPRRIGVDGEDGVDLAGAGDVPASALVEERVEHRLGRVRLDRVVQVDAGQRGMQLPVGVADRRQVDGEHRRGRSARRADARLGVTLLPRDRREGRGDRHRWLLVVRRQPAHGEPSCSYRSRRIRR